MAMFGIKKSKSSEGSELVLAYFEEAQRVRSPLTLIDPKQREVGAVLTAVTEERITLTTQGPILGEKGATVKLVFILDGLRLKAEARLIEAKPGSATLDLPSGLALAERRKKPRARLNAREGATATALTGLFDGIGISGPIENISEGGVCIRVDRAMDVKTQRKMPMGVSLLPIGQPMMLVKLSKLPKCPTLELEGRVAYLDARQGLLVGITFESGKDAVLAPVRALAASRTSAIPATVPPKARRQQESERAPDEAPYRPAPKKESDPTAPVRDEESVPPATEVPPPVAAAAPPPDPPATVEPAPLPVDERSQALLRVKKRARGILLAMPEGPERDLLAEFFTQDGYGRVLLAATLTELLEHLDALNAHLVLVEGVAEVQGLALASLLRHRQGDELPPMILAETSVDAELVLGAQETGVAQILVKPYEPDAEFARMIEAHLGIG
jgi:CheY-like chemotaxis protein